VSEPTPTRAAALELKAERAAMAEGYRLLDDKRLLLAAELLRELQRYARDWSAFVALHSQAAAALREALARHGLEGLQCYPAETVSRANVAVRSGSLFGVPLLEAALDWEREAAPVPAHPSPEAERCRSEHRGFVEHAAALAALAGNLRRLASEYRRTERRARALEDVLLPELDARLRALEERLDELEQEETALAHRAHRRSAPGDSGVPRLTG
jgi:V/A-type H+-transporting ATPase subunit D